MPLFRTSFAKARAESQHALEAELQRVVVVPPTAELAAELMPAFGPDGPRRGKSLTHRELIKWMARNFDFKSRAHRLLGSEKLRDPILEALQVLEHAELVRITVDSDRADNWRATRSGLAALAGGKDVVRQRITMRPGGLDGLQT